MDYGLPGSSVNGISQARILKWVAISFSRESSQLRDPTWVSCTEGRFFIIESPGTQFLCASLMFCELAKFTY